MSVAMIQYKYENSTSKAMPQSGAGFRIKFRAVMHP